LARWLVPMFALGGPGVAENDPARLRELIQILRPDLQEFVPLIIGLLSERHRLHRTIPYEMQEAVVLGVGRTAGLQYAVFEAMVCEPLLATNIPELLDPRRYNGLDAVRIMRFRLLRQSQNNGEPPELTVLYDAIEERWRQAELHRNTAGPVPQAPPRRRRS
jgi:hypothetical protein